MRDLNVRHKGTLVAALFRVIKSGFPPEGGLGRRGRRGRRRLPQLVVVMVTTVAIAIAASPRQPPPELPGPKTERGPSHSPLVVVVVVVARLPVSGEPRPRPPRQRHGVLQPQHPNHLLLPLALVVPTASVLPRRTGHPEAAAADPLMLRRSNRRRTRAVDDPSHDHGFPMTSAPVDDDARTLTHRHHHPPPPRRYGCRSRCRCRLKCPSPTCSWRFSLAFPQNISMEISMWWKFRSSKLTHFGVNVERSRTSFDVKTKYG